MPLTYLDIFLKAKLLKCPEKNKSGRLIFISWIYDQSKMHFREKKILVKIPHLSKKPFLNHAFIIKALFNNSTKIIYFFT